MGKGHRVSHLLQCGWRTVDKFLDWSCRLLAVVSAEQRFVNVRARWNRSSAIKSHNPQLRIFDLAIEAPNTRMFESHYECARDCVRYVIVSPWRMVDAVLATARVRRCNMMSCCLRRSLSSRSTAPLLMSGSRSR
jgi:hypothetical protein